MWLKEPLHFNKKACSDCWLALAVWAAAFLFQQTVEDKRTHVGTLCTFTHVCIMCERMIYREQINYWPDKEKLINNKRKKRGLCWLVRHYLHTWQQCAFLKFRGCGLPRDNTEGAEREKQARHCVLVKAKHCSSVRSHSLERTAKHAVATLDFLYCFRGRKCNLLSFLQGVHRGDNEIQSLSSTVRLFFQRHGIPVPRVCRGTVQRNSQALMEMCQTIDFSHYRCI